MAEKLLSGLYVSFALFLLVVGGGVVMLRPYADANVHGNSTSDMDKFDNTFDKVSEMEYHTDAMASRITDADETNWGLFGVLNALIGIIWNFFATIFSGIGFIFSFFGGITDVFGFVPTIVVTVISIIITSIVAFNIFGAIFQRRL